jgi:hypothetical protein
MLSFLQASASGSSLKNWRLFARLCCSASAELFFMGSAACLRQGFWGNLGYNRMRIKGLCREQALPGRLRVSFWNIKCFEVMNRYGKSDREQKV